MQANLRGYDSQRTGFVSRWNCSAWINTM